VTVARVVPVIAAVLVLAGCGGGGRPSDREDISTTITTYYKAFGSGDSATACNQLTSDATRVLEASGGGKDCTKLLDEALKRPEYAKIAPKLGEAKVVRVKVTGDTATAVAEVPGVGKKGVTVSTAVPLKKEGGAWKIASTKGAK
jgi:ketosteroid isomerase-like protein